MSRLDTSPPAHMTMPGRRERHDYTFRDERLMEISAHNGHLLRRLEEVASGKGAPGVPRAATARPRAVAVKSSHAVNRDRRAAEINRANAAMLSRLQSAKSSMKKAMAPPASLSAPMARSWAGGASRGGSGAGGAGGSGGVGDYYGYDDAAGVDDDGGDVDGGGGGGGSGPASPYVPLRAAAAHMAAAATVAAASPPLAARMDGGGGGGAVRARSAAPAPRIAARADGTMTAHGSRGRVGVPPPRGGAGSAFGDRDLRDVALHACRDDYLRD